MSSGTPAPESTRLLGEKHHLQRNQPTGCQLQLDTDHRGLNHHNKPFLFHSLACVVCHSVLVAVHTRQAEWRSKAGHFGSARWAGFFIVVAPTSLQLCDLNAGADVFAIAVKGDGPAGLGLLVGPSSLGARQKKRHIGGMNRSVFEHHLLAANDCDRWPALRDRTYNASPKTALYGRADPAVAHKFAI
eukprot:scaffold212865_cov48-Prasinocladus_malaysianus.AAC.3